jgi:hypothetical protein
MSGVMMIIEGTEMMHWIAQTNTVFSGQVGLTILAYQKPKISLETAHSASPIFSFL